MIKLRLIVMSTNLEYRVRERQRERESSEVAKLNDKGDRDVEREIKKQRRHFFVGRIT